MKYRNRTIYVDCDGTLVRGAAINRRLVDALKSMQDNGFTIICWSSMGKPHALDVCEAIGLKPSVCISKPAIIVDDTPEDILRYARVLKPNELQEDTLHQYYPRSAIGHA